MTGSRAHTPGQQKDHQHIKIIGARARATVSIAPFEAAKIHHLRRRAEHRPHEVILGPPARSTGKVVPNSN